MEPSQTIIDLYRRHARAWAAARAAGAFVEIGWLERFLAAIRPGAGVLDIGCGPGAPIARWLLDRGHPVMGVDSAPEMIAMFKANCPEARAMVADMRTLALGEAFAGLLAWDSFFHLSPSDQRAIFPIFAAHAQPGAALMFTSGSQAGVAMGELEGDPLYHASLNTEDYRDLLDAAGFDVLARADEDPDCGGRTVWLARRRA